MTSPRSSSSSRIRLRNLALAGLVSLAALAACLAASAPPAAAAETQITEGRLLWGVKESWRKYIGRGSEAGGGATVTGWAEDGDGKPLYAEGFSFPLLSGSYDDETRTTRLKFGGYAHFAAYCEASEPFKCLLDSRFSNLELEISHDTQVLRGDYTGYAREDPGGALHVEAGVVIAKYDIAGATTSFAGGVSSWTDVPTVAGPGNNLYGESTVLDDTSFEYTGPGGVPDLSEHWDTPGAPGLEAGPAWLGETGSAARVLYPSQRQDVLHAVDLVGAGTTTAKLVLAGLDAKTMQPLGSPSVWDFPDAAKNDHQELRTAFDPATDSVFFVTYNEGPGHDEATVRRASWDPVAKQYAVEAVGGLGSLSASRRVAGLAWNPVAAELAVIAYGGSASDGIYATDLLHRFRPAPGGGWSDQQALLRLPDDGEWAGASSVSDPFGLSSSSKPDLQRLAVARDGSYVFASGEGSATVGGARHYYPALHIVVAGDGSATVTPIAGTTTPRTALGTYYGFNSLATAADGSLLLHDSQQVMDAYTRVDVVAGAAVRVGGIVDAPADALPPYELAGFANSMAADAAHGIVWATDTFTPEGFQLDALRGDEVIGRYVRPDFPPTAANGGWGRLAIGPQGDVYMPIVDQASGRLGYRRLAFTGFAPEVTVQPQPRAVVLGPGEAAKSVHFEVAVAGDGAAVQWQSKSAGASAFADLPGATAGDLDVEADSAADGTVYRAVVSNAAGRVVSDEAALSVDYAPRIATDVANREVSEGADAHFLVAADGKPEPTVQWQRRVAGFWEPVEDDDNFAVDDAALTVLDTNTEQSGTLFRAKLSNAAGTVFSRQARLTVDPRTAIPAEGVALDRVSLDWSGNAEMQKAPPFGGSNYFSAGVSAGNEATYSAASGNVRVFQVAPGGAEALASWATRADHVLDSGSQLVRLYGGHGRVEPDGAATVAWDGAFSVNFYGGLVPFTISDPQLRVGADGDGTLSAELSGCASSQANPDQCEPLPPAGDVTVATFSGVDVDPAGSVTIQPDYDGVEVTLPSGLTPQSRSGSGWGAWPQSFVDFQAQTGLSSYWYSSGGAADPFKRPSPLLVNFAGEALPAAPGDQGGGGPGDGGATGGGDSSGQPAPPAQAQPTAAAIAAVKGLAGTDRRGRVTVATLRCPAAAACAVQAPHRVAVRIGRRAYRVPVLVPRTIAAGASAPLRVKLPRRALGTKRVTVKVPVTLRGGGRVLRRLLRVRVQGALAHRSVGADGEVVLGRVRCAAASPCSLRAPRRVAARAAGGRLVAKVAAPRRLAAHRGAKLGLALTPASLARLGSGSAVFDVRVVLGGAGGRSVRHLAVAVRRAAAKQPGAGGPAQPGTPRSEPISNEPPLLARPASAVDVSDVKIAWYPRDSWLRYAASGVAPGDGIFTTGGASGVDSTASACPDRPSSSDAQLPYEVDFTAKPSWYDPASGSAGIYGQGSVSFRWKAHTIDLTAADPEIEINGAASRAIFRFQGSGGTPYPNQRADLLSLDAAGQPTVSNGGRTFTYSLMRGRLTANGVNVFAGFYTPPDNDEFGCVSVSFTT